MASESSPPPPSGAGDSPSPSAPTVEAAFDASVDCSLLRPSAAAAAAAVVSPSNTAGGNNITAESTDRANSTTSTTTSAPTDSSALNAEQKLVQREKELVMVTDRSGGRSPFWNFGKLVSVKSDIAEEDVTPTIRNILNGVATYCVCMICYDCTDKRLVDALVKLTSDKSVSNLDHHIKARHYQKYLSIKAGANGSNSPKHPNALKVTGADGELKYPPTVQAHLPFKKVGNAQVRATLDSLIVTAGTTSGISDKAMMGDAMQDAFSYAIHNAKQLGRYVIPKQAKYATVQQREFGQFVCRVTEFVKDIESAWKEFLGTTVPFISVASDAWDGKNKEIFGLSVFIVHPKTFEYAPIALALLKLGERKTAIELSSRGMKGLERYGISRDLLYGSVTDNENTATKTGKLMVYGRNGRDIESGCDMHLAGLAAAHALGIKTRTEDKQVIDSFPAFVQFYKRVITLFKHFGSPSNSKFTFFKRVNEERSRSVLSFIVPNATRVSGVQLVFDCALRSKHSFDTYALATDAGELVLLKPSEWVQLAQYQSILRPITSFSFNVQTDRLGAGGEALYEMALIVAAYCGQVFYVVDVVPVVAWDGNAPMDVLPTTKMTTSPTKSTARGHPLMTDLSRMLRARVVKEIHHYFSKPTKRNLTSFAVHPLLATNGADKVVAILQYIESDDDEDNENIDDGVAIGGWRSDHFVADAKRALIDVIVALVPTAEIMSRLQNPHVQFPSSCSADTEEAGSDASGGDDDSDGDGDGNKDGGDEGAEGDDDDDILALIHKRQRTGAPAADGAEAPPPLPSVEEAARKEVDLFFGAHHMWPEELADQYRRMEKNQDYAMTDIVSETTGLDVLSFCKKFDLGEWWKSVGSGKYPVIALAAAQILSLPPSNAFQERVFSACTFFNSHLRRSMGEAKFEMAVLLTVNRIWLKEQATKSSASSNDIAATAAAVLQFFGIDASEYENMEEEEAAEAADEALSAALSAVDIGRDSDGGGDGDAECDGDSDSDL